MPEADLRRYAATDGDCSEADSPFLWIVSILFSDRTPGAKLPIEVLEIERKQIKALYESLVQILP